MPLQSTPPDLPLPYESPVRILVQSMTHLVPRDMDWDEVYMDKVYSMLARISRHHWHRVPVFCYEWTGESFKFAPQVFNIKDVQDELKDTPFTPAPYEPGERRPVRRTVRLMLREASRIPDRHLEYMQQHPEDMEWLQRKVRPRFWEEFLAQLESRPKEKEEDERQGIFTRPMSEDACFG